jgi:hypothetical protein
MFCFWLGSYWVQVTAHKILGFLGYLFFAEVLLLYLFDSEDELLQLVLS